MILPTAKLSTWGASVMTLGAGGFVAAETPVVLDEKTLLPIGIVVVGIVALLGAVWKLATTIAQSSAKLDGTVSTLADVAKDVGRLEERLSKLEQNCPACHDGGHQHHGRR